MGQGEKEMSNWIHFQNDWFNVDDFCHIWVETRRINTTVNHVPQIEIVGYYLLGEWRHNSEYVVISDDWKRKEDLIAWMSSKLGIGWTYKGETHE